MKKAILSDIHGNLTALEAVLADIRSKSIDTIYCLGDIIGYGPFPRECLQACRLFALNLMGIHEEGVLSDAVCFNPRARDAIEWTKQQLSLPDRPPEENRELWDFIAGLADRHLEDGVLYVHGSPREPIREHIFSSDVNNQRKMDEIFACLHQRLCFVGHTHAPGVFTEDYQHYPPASIGHRFELDDRKAIVGVGSVGQPRDGDPRPCYVTFDGEVIEFHRVNG